MKTTQKLSRQLTLLLAVEAGSLPVLQRLGSLAFLRTPGASLSAWRWWLEQTPAQDAVASVLRLVATAAAYWLLATTLLYLMAKLGHLHRVIRALGWTTLPAVRRLVDRAAALSVAVTLAGSATAWASGGPPPGPAPVVAVVGGHPGVLVPPGIRPLAPSAATPEPSPVPMPTPAPSPGSTTSPGPQPAPAGQHTVVAGENLWSISADHMGGADIAPYWRRVVEANRHSLRSGNPNLIFPGESISLPPTA